MKKKQSNSLTLPAAIWALFAVRLVVSAGSFVGPFLTMMLTMKLGYDTSGAGIFMFAIAIVSALGLLIGGKLGDSFDKGRVLRNLQALTALAFVVCALCGFTWYVPYIIAFAMGTLSGTWPVINALVADLSPVERRKESFSLLYWGNNIGFSLGPLVAGFLFNRFPRALFAGNALALFAAALLISIFVRKSAPGETGQAASGREESPRSPDDIESTRILEEASASAQAAARVSVLKVLASHPVLVLYGISAIVTAFVYNQHTFTLPLYLNDLLGENAGPQAYGMVMTVNGLTVVVFTMVMSFLSRKLPSLVAVALGSVFYAFGFGMYYFLGGLPLVLVATSVWTLGEILGATNGNAFIAERSPPAHRSRINSVISFCYIGGNALAPLAAGPLTKALGSRYVWPIIAVTALVSALMVFAIHRFDRKSNRNPVVF